MPRRCSDRTPGPQHPGTHAPEGTTSARCHRRRPCLRADCGTRRRSRPMDLLTSSRRISGSSLWPTVGVSANQGSAHALERRPRESVVDADESWKEKPRAEPRCASATSDSPQRSRLREMLDGLGLLHQQQPQATHHERRGRTKPIRGPKARNGALTPRRQTRTAEATARPSGPSARKRHPGFAINSANAPTNSHEGPALRVPRATWV
jgi:hypothetical protein